MPKALNIPPPLNTAQNLSNGARVSITEARKLIDQKTTIGTTTLGIGLTVNLNGALFSQMFSLDKAEIAGSAGRVLTAAGITDIDAKNIDVELKKLIGKQYTVMNKGGKIYWYP